MPKRQGLRPGHGRPPGRGPGARRWSSRGCRRTTWPRDTRPWRWRRCLPLWAAWGVWRGHPTASRAHDALVKERERLLGAHRRHRASAARAAAKTHALRPSASGWWRPARAGATPTLDRLPGGGRGPPRDRRLRPARRRAACRVTTAAAGAGRHLVHVPRPATSSGCSGRTAPASPRSSPSSARCSRPRPGAVEYGAPTAADRRRRRCARASACSGTTCSSTPS